MSEKPFVDLYLQVGEHRIRYWEEGDSGSPVVLIHGLGGFIENWRYNFKALSKHHHIYAVDLLGCGLTERPSAPYSVEFLAKFVQDFMALKNIEMADLIGHSLGARIAYQICLDNPDLVRKLVFVSGLGFGKKVAFTLRLLSLPGFGEILMKPSPDGTADYLKMLYYDHELITEEMVNFALKRSSIPGGQKAYLTTLRSGVNFISVKKDMVRNTVENASLINLPILVVWGNEDRLLPVEQAYNAEKLLPNGRLHIFEHCGHIPQEECYEEFNQLVLDFLAE